MSQSSKAQLSSATLAALTSFLAEDEMRKMTNGLHTDHFGQSIKDNDISDLSRNDNQGSTEGLDISKFTHVDSYNAGASEDFGMSQFWYTTETAEKLAKEALNTNLDDDSVGFKRVAFVSCPSAFKAAMRFVDEDTDITVFEYDRRFGEVYKDQYSFFDFNHPEHIDEEYHHVFDYVMADPPYLDDNCMQKTIQAMKLLARDENTPMCFNTGAVMADSIYKYAGFRESRFHPEHASKLGNEFSSFTNYESSNFGGWYDLEE